MTTPSTIPFVGHDNLNDTADRETDSRVLPNSTVRHDQEVSSWVALPLCLKDGLTFEEGTIMMDEANCQYLPLPDLLARAFLVEGFAEEEDLRCGYRVCSSNFVPGWTGLHSPKTGDWYLNGPLDSTRSRNIVVMDQLGASTVFYEDEACRRRQFYYIARPASNVDAEFLLSNSFTITQPMEGIKILHLPTEIPTPRAAARVAPAQIRRVAKVKKVVGKKTAGKRGSNR